MSSRPNRPRRWGTSRGSPRCHYGCVQNCHLRCCLADSLESRPPENRVRRSTSDRPRNYRFSMRFGPAVHPLGRGSGWGAADAKRVEVVRIPIHTKPVGQAFLHAARTKGNILLVQSRPHVRPGHLWTRVCSVHIGFLAEAGPKPATEGRPGDRKHD